jgi:hypothetical protein
MTDIGGTSVDSPALDLRFFPKDEWVIISVVTHCNMKYKSIII